MKHLIDDVRGAVAARNWYAALGLALALPDICGRLETPSEGSAKRFTRWFRANLEATYTSVGPSGECHTFLNGEDCYALRCAYLHEGDLDITSQRSRAVLERFHFVKPRPGMTIHCNQMNNALQLQVDVFCAEVCEGVERWLENIKGDAGIQARIATLPSIQAI